MPGLIDYNDFGCIIVKHLVYGVWFCTLDGVGWREHELLMYVLHRTHSPAYKIEN